MIRMPICLRIGPALLSLGNCLRSRTTFSGLEEFRNLRRAKSYELQAYIAISMCSGPAPGRRKNQACVFLCAGNCLAGALPLLKTPVQSVFRLVIDGSLHIDWWKPLGLESKSEHHAGRPPDLAFSVRGERCH